MLGITRFLLPVLALGLIAAAGKPKATVRFHVEVNPNSGEPFVLSTQMPGEGQKVTLSKIPEISENDVVAIYPFPADDGTAGCAFKLDAHGKLALDTVSSQARGARMVGFVNNRPVTAMLIDRRISDGIITITRGLTPEDVLLLRKAFPVLGERKAPKGKGETFPTPVPAPAPLSFGAVPRGD